MNSKKILALLLSLVMLLSFLVSCDAIDQINKLINGDDVKPNTDIIPPNDDNSRGS